MAMAAILLMGNDRSKRSAGWKRAGLGGRDEGAAPVGCIVSVLRPQGSVTQERPHNRHTKRDRFAAFRCFICLFSCHLTLSERFRASYLQTDLPDVPLFLAPLAEAQQGESGQSGKGGLLWAMREAAGAVGPAQAIKAISPHITKAVCVMFAPLPFADSSESEEDETPLLTTSLLLTALLTCGVCCLKSGSQPCVYLGGVPAADSGVMQALDEVERHLKAIPWTKVS
ncbi:unnamed protein product [Vitrella brassicaformis CCMP3155]|uniref:Uncharacterized protein n=1 Tax=Vitrella brassicaformis (strain CCMP3155) TaxID=1169540 RepID=A0A0G4EIZ9_VITBC|nr:unnamed protein product [Vitrella brassicaformis CCMP3155]|eukprot:CEL95884.1 unnamed protein product [Vitrella brassicaformis CCMP3155]